MSSSGGGGGGLGSSSGDDSVRSTRDMTDSVRAQFQAARKNPEKEIGISLEELDRRQKEARRPHAYVSDETSRKFEVKSSARAQQIMNQGIDKFQREKRRKDLKQNLSMLRKVQVMLCICVAGLFGWLAVNYLLPQYAAVQNRNRRMQLRYDRAQQSLREADAVEGVSSGPVMRVFRVGEGEEKPDTVKRTIQ